MICTYKPHPIRSDPIQERHLEGLGGSELALEVLRRKGRRKESGDPAQPSKVGAVRREPPGKKTNATRW